MTYWDDMETLTKKMRDRRNRAIEERRKRNSEKKKGSFGAALNRSL